MKNLEYVTQLLINELGIKHVEPLHKGGGGCISQGEGYKTDIGDIFLKFSDREKAKQMLDGECASLQAIYDTDTIKVPKPIKVMIDKSRSYLAMEFINILTCQKQKLLGQKLAELHRHNLDKYNSEEKNIDCFFIDKFGFHVTTCCGYLPLKNDWNSDWIDFYTEQRLQVQIDWLTKKHTDSELCNLWQTLKPLIPRLFEKFMNDNNKIKPSLLHGDLWGGNIGQTDNGEPIVFDPAAFYGHHEFDLAIAGMFGGFTQDFYNAYHAVFPKTELHFKERQSLYQLFHYLNHWNHFGSGYRSSSISIMKSLIRTLSS